MALEACGQCYLNLSEWLKIISSNASVLEYSSPVEWPLLRVLEQVLGDAVCEISTYCLVTGLSPFHLGTEDSRQRTSKSSFLCLAVHFSLRVILLQS